MFCLWHRGTLPRRWRRRRSQCNDPLTNDAEEQSSHPSRAVDRVNGSLRPMPDQLWLGRKSLPTTLLGSIEPYKSTWYTHSFQIHIHIYSYLLQTAFHIIQNGSRTQSKSCIISVIEGKGFLFRFAWGKFRYTYYIHPYMFWRIRSKGCSFLCISKMMYIKNDVDVDVFILWKPPTCNYFSHVKRKMM